jgi:hypothetical protein
MDPGTWGKWLVGVGLGMAVLGLLVWLTAHLGLPLGRLPGDLRLGGENWSVHIPIVTCILLSIVLSIVLNLLLRLFR